MKEQKTSTKDKVFTALKILAILWITSSIIALFFSFDTNIDVSGGNVAIIPIYGEISVSEGNAFSSQIVSSETVIANLEKADHNPNIKAILLDINSPGGSPVPTDEIGQKIKSINKTTVAVIREVGASGAYWIASSSDYIFANRLSILGSIGVIGSYLDFSGLMTRYNVTYQRFVSGELKDMGSPYKEPTKEEREVLQQIIDKMRSYFVEEVAANRNLSIEKVDKLATGQIFLGVEAKDLGLIDDIGTKADALRYIEIKMNMTARPVEYKEKKSFSDILAGLISNIKPQIGNFINPLNPTFKLS